MKLQYLIAKDKELTTDYISNAIQDFSTRRLPRLNKLMNYYQGKQKITRKRATDVGKPCNIVVVNYCYNIVKNFLGYLVGKPIAYDNDDFQEVLDILKYNDVAQEDTTYLKNALIMGRAFECNYIDEEGKQRFRWFDTRECIPVYDNSLNNELLYVIRFYQEDLLDNRNSNYIVEVYGPTSIKTYRSVPGFTSMTLLNETPHFFGQCPVTVFSLNEDEDGIFEQVISLQDAYNDIYSGSVDDWDAFCDAYLVLKGVVADQDTLDAMKKNRVLMIDNDADAQYLIKNDNNSRLEYLLKVANDQIHKIANSPDFTDEKFMAQSGEAIKYKLVGFETAAAEIENNMRKALQRRIELIAGILSLVTEEQQWRDVQIKFTRNLPTSIEPNTIQDLISLKALLPTRDILAMMPYVQDPDKVAQEKQEEDQILIDMNRGDSDEWQ